IRSRYVPALPRQLTIPRPLGQRVIPIAGLVAFCVFAWWTRLSELDLRVAWQGFSPIAYVYKSVYPDNFRADFPAGFEVWDGSAFLQAYKLAYAVLGVSPERILGP